MKFPEIEQEALSLNDTERAELVLSLMKTLVAPGTDVTDAEVLRRDAEILRYYEKISPRLGDEFWVELTHLLDLISSNPERFHFADPGLRRANMKRFPYHVLFRVKPISVRVIVIRHNKRRPSYGSTRQ